MIDSTVNIAVALRLRKWAGELQHHIDYVKSEQEEARRTGESSWMDGYSQEDIARNERQIADLKYAAELLDKSPDLQFDPVSSK